MERFGIDISEWQNGIDLSKAKNEGVEFVIVRGSYTGSKNKSLVKDKSFEKHYKNSKANGLGVGVYHFSRACSYEEGKKEADFLYENCLKNKEFEYPIYIDVEDNVYQAKAGKTAITQAIKGFCETLENKGYYVGIYASSNWFKNYINTAELNMYDKWIAQWSKSKPTEFQYGMWQFGGETNKVRSNKIAGIICDQNYVYYDYPNIIKQKGLNGFIQAPEQSYIESSKEEDIKDNTQIIHFNIGDSVILNENSTEYQHDSKGVKIPTTIKSKEYTIKQVDNDCVLLAEINSWVLASECTPLQEKATYLDYTIKKGDTLWNLAKKYNTSVDELVKLNNIKNANIIITGQVIKIPR